MLYCWLTARHHVVVYRAIHGPHIATELLHSTDNEAHSALDWAADSGDVNVIEFFVRKGLNPYRADVFNRSPLFWAVKSNRVDAVRFLVMCGCDPFQQDIDQRSPMSIARSAEFNEIVKVLALSASQHLLSSSTVFDSARLCTGVGAEKFSHAVFHHNKSDLLMTSIFCCFFLVIWLLTIFVPFYVWIFVVVSGWYLFR
jgi:hypothetical protein